MNNVIEYLNYAASVYPDKMAFVDTNGGMTFSQLNISAKKIAMAIIHKTGGVVNQPIAVMMHKGKECIAAFMGIIYSGNYYSPIDTSMPEKRVNLIMKELSPVLVIAETANTYVCENLCTYEKCMNQKAIDEKMIEKQLSKVLNIDPVYVLFTSGSTGVPKGVVVSHAGVIDYTEWLKKTFHFDENTIFGNQAPLYFDNSILDIYSCLKNGSTVYFIEEKMFSFHGQLMRYLIEKRINTIFWVPSALIGVADSNILEKIDELPGLNNILFCGEVMPAKQLAKWMKKFEGAVFANLYGPTEITDVCTYFIVDRIYGDNEILPIGKACENTEILIINENGQYAEINETGEILVRGIGVSKGYYRNDEKSNAAFIQNPLHNDYRDIVYKTGDLGKIDENGNIIYIGRIDNQIKYQGHRIELGEIESAANSISGVKRTCAVFSNKRNKIVLYVLTEELNEKEIYVLLKNKIPRYMLPAEIIILEELPQNVNGKIDRVRLKEDADTRSIEKNNRGN